MKNKLSLLFLSLFVVLSFTSCEDSKDPFNGPYRLVLLGSDEVAPETTEEFRIGDFTNPEAYTWSVEGPAEIVGSNTGTTVSVKFNSVGEVVISATNGVDSGRRVVTVAEEEAAVTADLNGMGALYGGASDTVFFNFAAPVEGMPTLALLTADDSTAFNEGHPFLSAGSSLGELQKVDAQHFYAVYTAGEGNGTPEAVLRNIQSTATYGSVKTDSAFVQLYRVDNVAPVASLSYSSDYANDNSSVTITATFSEKVMSAAPSDSVLFITLNGAGMQAQRDTLMPTDNPLVYTYEYIPEGGANGQVQVGLDNVADMAGNELAGVNNTAVLVVDNLDPVVVGTATDAGSSAALVITSTESGTGMYVVMTSGATAPETPEEFMAASGAASGSVQLKAGQAKAVAEALAKGNYTVYFLAKDMAGNYSDITAANLSMN